MEGGGREERVEGNVKAWEENGDEEGWMMG